MGVPTSEVGYTSATARRGDHESSYEHVVALEKKKERMLMIVLHFVLGRPVVNVLFWKETIHFNLGAFVATEYNKRVHVRFNVYVSSGRIQIRTEE